MDQSKKILNILKKVGAIITDSHFVLTSGRHAKAYVNKDFLYLHTQEVSKVAKIFAQKTKDLDVDVVVGPALGGIILSQWTAHHLSKIKGKEVLSVYTEKDPAGNQIFTRGYDKVVAGKKVLLVEDLTSTGGSVKKSMNSIVAAGGKVAGIAIMANRNPKAVTAELFGVPFFPMAVFEVDSFEEAECPMCKAGVPINTSVGHGKKFLEAKGLK
jgi:orotate phosphoribosyltransferase